GAPPPRGQARTQRPIRPNVSHSPMRCPRRSEAGLIRRQIISPALTNQPSRSRVVSFETSTPPSGLALMRDALLLYPCKVFGDLPRVSPCAIHSSSSVERVTISVGSTSASNLPSAISETSLASCFLASAIPTPFSLRG